MHVAANETRTFRTLNRSWMTALLMADARCVARPGRVHPLRFDPLYRLSHLSISKGNLSPRSKTIELPGLNLITVKHRVIEERCKFLSIDRKCFSSGPMC